MLLKFETKNFKSFVDKTTFSMLSAPKQKDLSYSLFPVKSTGASRKGLCSSVIYGPNAAGKTNIIGAMEVLQAIIAKGNIFNSSQETSPNAATASLEFIPNNQLKKGQPVEFYIDFLDGAYRFQYELKIDIGTFLDADYSRKILEETLYVNKKLIFKRDNDLFVDHVSIMEQQIEPVKITAANGLVQIAKNSLTPTDLFLTNGFKLIFSQPIVQSFTEWFAQKFMVIYRADSMQLLRRFADPQKKTIYIEQTVNHAAKLFGISSNAIGYVPGSDESLPKLCSLFNIKDNKTIGILAEIFESYGTIRFVNMFPLVIRAIVSGATLVVDEFDASIHPMALMNIINIFHNDEINRNHAQLIFNTHNPIFLNSNLFRRDEIKFVERDEETQKSIIYSLSDFGTSGENGVRKGEDYMKNYFISQYGAIKNIDFTPVFEEILSSAKPEV